MKKLLSPYSSLDPGKNNKGSLGDPIFIARAGSFIKWPVGGRETVDVGGVINCNEKEGEGP